MNESSKKRPPLRGARPNFTWADLERGERYAKEIVEIYDEENSPDLYFLAVFALEQKRSRLVTAQEVDMYRRIRVDGSEERNELKNTIYNLKTELHRQANLNLKVQKQLNAYKEEFKKRQDLAMRYRVLLDQIVLLANDLSPETFNRWIQEVLEVINEGD